MTIVEIITQGVMNNTLHALIGNTALYATPEEADKLAILTPEFDVIIRSLKKMKMAKSRLLYELDKSPENKGKQAKLKQLMDDIDRYHGKATQKKAKITRIVQKIKWRGENKKRGIS